MIKEIKYLIYTVTISGFIFFILNFYLSEENKKNSYRSINNFENKIFNYSESLHVLKSDTDNIIEYVDFSLNKNKKKYKFWELIIDNEK